MPRDDASTFGDLLGRLDWLEIVCTKCDRHGHYYLHGLASTHGRNFKIVDWIGEMTKDCVRKKVAGTRRRMRSQVPGPAKVPMTLQAIAANLTGVERMMLFCLASNTDWANAGVTGATVQHMVVRDLVDRDAAGLTPTDQGRAVRC
jgi:hypothetical protein